MTWSVLSLGDLCEFRGGSVFPKKYQGLSVGRYPFIKVSDLALTSNTCRINEANNRIDDSIREEIRAKVHPTGAVVFAKIGEGLKNERIRSLSEPTIIDNNMMAAIPSAETDPVFLRYLIEYIGISQYSEGSALPYLRQGDLEKISVFVPEHEAQVKISRTLGALDDKIESNQRQIRLAEQIILLRFNSSFDVAECEDGVLVSELIEVGPKRSLTKGDVAPYVGMTHLPEFSLSVGEWEEKEYSGGQRFINGDVLMARITPCLENGKTAIVDMLPPGQVGFGSTEYIVLAPRGNFSTAWIYGFVRNEHIREWAIKQMNGSSGRQRFPASAFGTYRIKSPHPDILKAFNQKAAGLLELCRVRRNENRRLAALRDTLLAELLSGRITPEQLEAGL